MSVSAKVSETANEMAPVMPDQLALSTDPQPSLLPSYINCLLFIYLYFGLFCEL